MQIIHKGMPRTSSAKETLRLGGVSADEAAGAFYLPASDDRGDERLRPMYIPIGEAQLGMIIDSADPGQHIIGCSEEIEAELLRRHPPPRGEVTYIDFDHHNNGVHLNGE